eukprot:scaffold5380_cov131-Cylindrotheca_fusiformis.AAC.11
MNAELERVHRETDGWVDGRTDELPTREIHAKPSFVLVSNPCIFLRRATVLWNDVSSAVQHVQYFVYVPTICRTLDGLPGCETASPPTMMWTGWPSLFPSVVSTVAKDLCPERIINCHV